MNNENIDIDLSESEEMYLESILVLSIENDKLRSVDIANYMDFSKPSVSVAIKKLKNYGLVNNEDNLIELTEKGREIAENVYEKHNILASIFIYLGVDKKQAIEDACRLEHHISDEAYTKLKEYFRPKLDKNISKYEFD